MYQTNLDFVGLLWKKIKLLKGQLIRLTIVPMYVHK